MSAEFDTSKNGLALGSFIAALAAVIIEILGFVIPEMDPTLAIILGIVELAGLIVAIILGAIALKKKIGIKGLAVAGLVIGIVLLALNIIAIIALLAFGVGLVIGGVGGAVGGVAGTISVLGGLAA